jgi:hypothetical protein
VVNHNPEDPTTNKKMSKKGGLAFLFKKQWHVARMDVSLSFFFFQTRSSFYLAPFPTLIFAFSREFLLV